MNRVVVIEDNSDVSRIIGDMLRDSGYEVLSYFTPSGDIVEHVMNYDPALVILDARLNGPVTGWDIIRGLKEDLRTHAIPIIVVTAAHDQIEANRDLLERYDVPVLTKPFELADLDALVGQMVVG